MNSSLSECTVKSSFSLTDDEKNEVTLFFSKLEFRPHYNHPDWAAWVEPYKRPMYFRYYRSEELVGFAIVYVRMGMCVMKFAPVTKEFLDIPVFIDHIVGYLKRQKYGLLTVHLPLLQDQKAGGVRAQLKSTNWAREGRPGWSTLQIRLEGRTVEDVFKDFSKGHKSSVKKAIKDGVEVRPIAEKRDLERLAGIYDEMHHRKGLILPLIDSAEAFTCISEMGQGIFSGVFKGDQLLGGVVFVSEGNLLLYKFGATDVQYHDVPVLHLAIYDMVRYGIETGHKKLDLCGYDPNAAPGSFAFGVNQFKKGFGGEVVTYVQPFSMRLDLVKYWLSAALFFAGKLLPVSLLKRIYSLRY